MLNRPPPYFPQNQLNPPDSKRYLKFKIIVALLALGLLFGLALIGVLIYYFIRWAMA